MWIKEKPKQLFESGRTEANFLYKKGKIYVMDNHLCAAWCWLQEVDVNKTYDLVHIDRHNDLLNPIDTIKKDLSEDNVDLKNISFEEYLELTEKNPEEPDINIKLFRWDNYILSLEEVYHNFFGKKYFITQESYPGSDFITHEASIEEFIDNFDFWIKDSKNGCIVNLDIDFFYSNNSGFYKQVSSEIVKKVANTIIQNISKIDVITIALSPECCGGWENAFQTMKIFNEIMELEA